MMRYFQMGALGASSSPLYKAMPMEKITAAMRLQRTRKHMKETEKRVEILKQDNNKMEERIKLLSKELVFLKNLFLAHETSAHGPQLDDVQFMLEEDVEGEQE